MSKRKHRIITTTRISHQPTHTQKGKGSLLTSCGAGMVSCTRCGCKRQPVLSLSETLPYTLLIRSIHRLQPPIGTFRSHTSCCQTQVPSHGDCHPAHHPTRNRDHVSLAAKECRFPEFERTRGEQETAFLQNASCEPTPKTVLIVAQHAKKTAVGVVWTNTDAKAAYPRSITTTAYGRNTITYDFRVWLLKSGC